MRDDRAYLEDILEAIERVDLDKVWGVVENDLPELKRSVRSVLGEDP